MRKRLGQLDAQEWTVLGLLFVCGVALVLGGHQVGNGAVGSAMREAGVVTIGTVGVALIYEFLLSKKHERELLGTVQDGLISRARDAGLCRIDKLDFADLFKRLGRGDELWWLDTYCPDVQSEPVQRAIERALQAGAVLRILVIDPDCFTAEARAIEIDALRYADQFRPGARHAREIFEDIARRFKESNSSPRAAGAHSEEEDEALEPIEIRTYADLPCAPLYLRMRNGVPVEGWSSYFLSWPTVEVGHFYWSPSRGEPGDRSPSFGLGLDAFQKYFEGKWDRWAPSHADAALHRATASPEALADQTRATLAGLRNLGYSFVLGLLEHELRSIVIDRGQKVLADGKLHCPRNALTRELLFSLAANTTISVVHSTSENRMFDDRVGWGGFYTELTQRVADGRLTGVRRLFVVDAMSEMEIDAVLAAAIAFHNETSGYECRILERATYDRIKRDEAVTRSPMYDFGIYGAVAHVWPEPGYSRPESETGYFEVDTATVTGLEKVFERCWTTAVRSLVAQ